LTREGKKVKTTIRKFKVEMRLWNFESVFEAIKEDQNFPEEARKLIESLMFSYGNCGSPRTHLIGVPKAIDAIMILSNSWMKGGKKPKAIAA
jgi:hypothetical protein